MLGFGFDFDYFVAEPAKLILGQLYLLLHILLGLLHLLSLDLQQLPQLPQLLLVEANVAGFGLVFFDEVATGQHHHAFLVVQLLLVLLFEVANAQLQLAYFLVQKRYGVVILLLHLVQLISLRPHFLSSPVAFSVGELYLSS